MPGGLSRLYLGIVVGVVLGHLLFGDVSHLSSRFLRPIEADPRIEIVNGTYNPNFAQKTMKLADNCYHILLDVGANRGVHGRFLFEPHKYPNAHKAAALYKKTFGPDYDLADVCVFAFEPNPSHHPRLHEISEVYQALGWRFHVIPKGVSDTDDVLNFFRRDDTQNEEWGFSVLPPPAGQAIKETVPIPVIRLASWIQQHVEGRILPSPHKAMNNTPRVLMKLDIEGMEFRVMPDLMYSGVFCNTLDLVFGEVHRGAKRFPIRLSVDDILQDHRQGKVYWQVLQRAVSNNPSCATRFIEIDDESYLHDGQPLPTRDDAISAV